MASKHGKNIPREKTDVVFAEIQQMNEQIQKGRNKIPIYRPGHAPAFATEIEDDDDTSLVNRRLDIRAKLTKGRKIEAPQVIEAVKPEEKRRPVTAEIIEADTSSRRVAEAVIVKAEPIDVTQLSVPKAESEEDEDDAEDRRARARRRAAEKAKREEEEEAKKEDEELKEAEEEEEEEESEYETESEDEDMSSRQLMKPIFVSKKARETLEEREKREQEEIEIEMQKQARLVERKKESKQILIEELQREEDAEAAAAVEGHEVLPDDSDDVDEAAELEAWKLRELRRLHRDALEREQVEQERAETLRRRNMTDAEIAAEDAKNPHKQKEKKSSYKFLQKYYHAGAFFRQEDDEIFKRDFSAPTGQDAEIDRQFLPKVLQVKKFGIKGRTKYTHLVDQDTSAPEKNPWAQTQLAGLTKARPLTGTHEHLTQKKR